jgi:FtsP/CotA-like multicopper oxidase with cupredoxin domain
MKYQVAWLVIISYVFLCFTSVVFASTLQDPLVLSSPNSEWSTTLTLQPARYSDTRLSFTGRQFCYQSICSYPGPTIELKPGDTLHLTIINQLEAETVPYSYIETMKNIMHWPNTTNIHTHGLHIDPLVDSVFVDIAPGTSYTYVYKLPYDHAPGLHWYHSHAHGSAHFSTMSGQHGAISVPSGNATINVPSSYMSMSKHMMVLSHLQFAQEIENGIMSQACKSGAGCTVFQGCAANTTNSPFVPFRSYSFMEMSSEIGNLLPPAPVYVGGVPINQYVVNGQYQPSIHMQPGEYHILRVVHTGGSYVLQLNAPMGCTFGVVAIDGVFLRSVQTRMSIYMNPAGRWEIQVMCSVTGTYNVQGVSARLQQMVFSLIVSGPAATTNTAAITDAQLAAIKRPAYLADLSTAVPSSKFSVHLPHAGPPDVSCGFWLGSGSNCSGVWNGDEQPRSELIGNTCPFEAFRGRQGGNGSDPWNPASSYKHVTSVGQINEWRITGMSMEAEGMDTHPFHLHVNHMQVIAFTPTPMRMGMDMSMSMSSSMIDYTQFFTLGEWRDTLPSLDGELIVRFTATYPGETIFHCHTLRHEDLGMMSSFYVCDPNVPGACPPALDATCDLACAVTTSTGINNSTFIKKNSVNICTSFDVQLLILMFAFAFSFAAAF